MFSDRIARIFYATMAPAPALSKVVARGRHAAAPERAEASRNRPPPAYLMRQPVPGAPDRAWEGAMIYVVAFLLPPLGLLLNGQPFSAIFNLLLIVPCLLLGLVFPLLWLVPSLHAVVAVHMRREDRKHRELVQAIEKHGPPPWWLR
jgi:hypothetical protein